MRGYRRNIRRSEFEFSSAVDLTELDPDQRRRMVHSGSRALEKDSQSKGRDYSSFDIKRKGLPGASASRPDERSDDSDGSLHDGATDRPKYVLHLENEMTAVLGLKDAAESENLGHSTLPKLGQNQASSDRGSDVSREFEALANKRGGADGGGSYFDSSSIMSTTTSDPDVSPLLPPWDKADRPLHSGQCNDCRPQVEQNTAKADARQRNAVRYFSSSPFPSPRLAPLSASMTSSSTRQPAPPVEFSLSEPHGEHRRGSSAPLQLRPIPSVSSLGTDLDPNRPSRGPMLAPANLSRVSLPSDLDLGNDEKDSIEQHVSTATVPSTADDPGSHTQHKGRSTMVKIVGKIRRPSNSANADPKTAAPTGSSPSQPQHRSPLDRLSGLFARPHGRSEPQSQQHLLHQPVTKPLPSSPGPRTPEFEISSPSMDRLHPVSSQPSTPGQHFNRSPGHSRPSSALENATFQGQPPPPGGYFAPFNPDSFSRFRDPQESTTHLAQPTHADNPDIRIPSPTRIPQHTDSGRSGSSGNRSLSPRSPRFVPPPLQQQQYNTTHLTSPVPSPVPRTPPSRGRSQDCSYAEDLHLRSRSPKAFAPRPNEKHIPSTDVTDPAHILGTFRSSNPRLSRIGDQERPWKLSLPGLDDEAGTFATCRRHTTAGALPSQDEDRLPTYEEDGENHPHPPALSDEKSSASPSRPPREVTSQQQQQYNQHPTRGHGRSLNNIDAPVELPVRREDDSGEEITMSSTAYPGQEWRPLGFSEWDP
ncbi:hypothetical protein FE257_000396 [Aspergillus nanangensis]|uniref:Uncharacterized protein n=1 Tax=Aspergillus nanangensis TaxID=2582783 RepID=A0AAD4CUQ5_ASPNN|nr:hypothetical protein FE257_000396 [Aspergillus nanangensis]